MSKGLVMHYATNESVDAVVSGLDLHPHDSVLAICGAGDQAFAMLEYVGQVVAVDTSNAQIEYAKRRLEMIKQGKFDDFMVAYLDIGKCPVERTYDTKPYFEVPGRLENIRDNAQNIVFQHGNIFDFPQNGHIFSRIYLSNALGYGVTNIAIAGAPEFARIVPLLRHKGLIYISNMNSVRGQLRHVMEFMSEDEELTRKAQQKERGSSWTPAVLRKRLPWHE